MKLTPDANNKLSLHGAGIEKEIGEIPEDSTIFRLSSLFKIFGDGTRLKILFVLSESDMCVYYIAEKLNMTMSAISHQLSVLKKANLVSSRREGKTIFYSLADDHVRTIITQGMEHISE